MVSSQGTSLAQAQPRGSFLEGVLRSLFSFILTTSLVSVLLIVGWTTIRRYTPTPATVGSGPGSMAAPTSAFAPKEYNKVGHRPRATTKCCRGRLGLGYRV